MKRSGVVALAVFFALTTVLTTAGLVATAQPAAASVFCGADIAGLVPWDVATDSEIDGQPTRLYGFEIGADQSTPSSGTMIVVTDKEAYKIPFVDARFVPYPDDPKRFYSSGHMFALPEAAKISYAWVDDATDPTSGKDATCVTIPFEVKPNPDPSASASATTPSTPFTLDRYSATTATFLQKLPAMTCGATYTAPEIIDMPTNTDFWDTSEGTHAKPVLARISLGSDGRPINVLVIKSSGSVPVDVAAQDTAARGHYKAATFLCSPAASTLDYEFDYSVRT